MGGRNWRVVAQSAPYNELVAFFYFLEDFSMGFTSPPKALYPDSYGCSPLAAAQESLEERLGGAVGKIREGRRNV